MSIAEIIEDDGEREPLPIRVRRRAARPRGECSLFDELDRCTARRGRDVPAFPTTRAHARAVAQWLAQPDSTVLLAQSDEGVVGLVVLLTRAPSSFAARCRARWSKSTISSCAPISAAGGSAAVLAAAVEWSRRAGRRMSSRRADSTATPSASTSFGFAASVDRLILALKCCDRSEPLALHAAGGNHAHGLWRCL